MVIMSFTYIAYFLLRRGIDEATKRARFGSIYLIIGFITVPITFFSARLLRSIHPTIFNAGGGEKMVMTAPMYQTMGFSIVVFTLLFVLLLIVRSRLRIVEMELDAKQSIEN
jgi:heme exporter protein C